MSNVSRQKWIACKHFRLLRLGIRFLHFVRPKTFIVNELNMMRDEISHFTSIFPCTYDVWWFCIPNRQKKLPTPRILACNLAQVSTQTHTQYEFQNENHFRSNRKNETCNLVSLEKLISMRTMWENRAFQRESRAVSNNCIIIYRLHIQCTSQIRLELCVRYVKKSALWIKCNNKPTHWTVAAEAATV